MTTQLERIEYELKKAGFNLKEINEINSDDDYSESIGTSVYKVCKEFCSHGHSGFSAHYALRFIKTLLIDEKPLSPLTNDPTEWVNVGTLLGGKKCFQSKRDFSCFSDDGLKTYYDIDDPDNKEWELDKNGNKTGWSSIKKSCDCKKIELKDHKEEEE